MYRPLVYFITTLFSLPLIIATASSQFHLNPLLQVSDCFYTCHLNLVANIELGNKPNSAVFITDNCAQPQWREFLPPCLAQTCISAPDAAYGLEYAKSFCKRAGVDVSNMSLPDTYVQEASEYFQSEAYLSGAEKITGVMGLGATGAVVGLAVVGLM